MEKSESIKNITTALLKFHSEVGKIYKKSDNPFFKSKYAALPDILSEISEPLQNAGLVIVQLPDGESLTTMIIHSESGEYLSTTTVMKPTKADPQSMGSAITYYRRYCIAAILSLNIDIDDDGVKASKGSEKKQVNEKLITVLIDVERCESVDQLNEIWKDNKEFRKDEKFYEAVKVKKESLTFNI